MAYLIDGVYQTDGTELSNANHTTTLSGASHMAYDGRYLWVTCGNAGIAIYEWWGAASDNEPTFENLDDLIYPRYNSGANKKLRLVTYITLTATQMKRSTALPSMADVGAVESTGTNGLPVYTLTSSRTGVVLNAAYIKRCNGKMFVSNSTSFKELYEFDIATQSFTKVHDVSETYTGNTTGQFTNGVVYTMNSNLEAAFGKIWFVGSSFGDTKPQQFYALDVETGVKTARDINVRPSRARTSIAQGFNGFIYMTDYNNVSINKYNADTGAWVETIRVNAFATGIFSGPDRRIWVSSFGGMISLVDWDDSEVHNDWSSGEGDTMRATSLQVDPTDGSKIWFTDVNNKLVRHDLNTHEQLDQGTTEDWNFSNLALTAPEKLWISQEMTYQDAALASHTIKPYIFLINGGKLLAWRLDRYLYRVNFATTNGQGAVVSSPQQYFGE